MSLIEGDDRRGDVTRSIPVEPTGADVYRRVIEQLSAVRLTLRGVAGALAAARWLAASGRASRNWTTPPSSFAGLFARIPGRRREATRVSPVACWRW